MPRWIGPRKYAPLTAYLAGLHIDQVMLTFAEIEQIIGAALPPTAGRQHWWANTRAGSAQGRAWLDAGWRVAAVYRGDEPPAVTFARVPPASRR